MTEEELLASPPRYGRLDVPKAQRLYKKGYSTSIIGKVLGVNQKTVWRHLQANKQEQHALIKYKADRADILANVQAKSLNLQAQILATMKDGIIKALKPGEKTGLLMALNAQHGTLFDKERLERNLSTTNQSIHSTMLDTTVKGLYAPDPGKTRQSKRKQTSKQAPASVETSSDNGQAD